MSKLIPTEHQECIALAQYLSYKDILFSHIPNETYTTSWSQKRKNKEAGVQKGVPDYLIMVEKHQSRHNRPILLFIEMKRQKRSQVSPEQKKWLESLNKVADVQGYVCKGFDEAKKVLDCHIK